MWTLKSVNQTAYGFEPRLQSWRAACHRKGDGRSICICALRHVSANRKMWVGPLFPLPPPMSSVVCILPYLSPRLICMPLLSMPTSSRRCGFPRLMGGCFSRCCGFDAPSLPEPASHHLARAGWELLSWSPLVLHYHLEQLCDEVQSGSFLRGEPEQSSAGEHFSWPALLTLENKQTQQFRWVSHA